MIDSIALIADAFCAQPSDATRFRRLVP